MTPAERAAALRDAAAIVDRVVASLDRTSSSCEHCGVTKYTSFDEYKEATELTAVSRKLLRFAASEHRADHDR